MRRLLAILAVLAAVAVARAELSFYDGVAAYVDDKVVTVETVLLQMRMNFDLSKVPPAELPTRIRELFPVVRDMIVDRMLILKAYEESGAQLPNEAVNARVKEIIAESFEGSEPKLRALLRKQRMTYEAWVKQVREDMIVQAMRQLQVGKKVSVSPKVVKLYYAEHMDDFAEAGGVHVRTILLPPSQPEALADDLLAQLAAGADFAELARRYSADGKAAEGGDWGVIQPQELFSPQMAEAIAALKVGERTVVESAGYRSIVEKVAVQRGKRPAFAEAYPRVEAAVKQQLGQARYNAWIEGLRAKAYIKLPEVKF